MKQGGRKGFPVKRKEKFLVKQSLKSSDPSEFQAEGQELPVPSGLPESERKRPCWRCYERSHRTRGRREMRPPKAPTMRAQV